MDEPRELDPDRDALQWLRPVPYLLEPSDDGEVEHELLLHRWRQWVRDGAA